MTEDYKALFVLAVLATVAALIILEVVNAWWRK